MQFSSQKIRSDFINFFKSKQHQFIRSSPVLPLDDPTLLFTNAGMNQFKKFFLDKETPEFNRVTNSQKCIRVSGKHNDLEEVGVDKFHHTFFEMLGNWSFGDYYKKESIKWSWELLTEVWKLDKNRLWVTVYKDDNEAEKLWIENTDVDQNRILRFGNKDNFWEMGDTGPCGPCSEIHYYIGDLDKQKSEGVNKDPDYRELWNLVFIEFNRKPNGKLDQLSLKHVDTGAGLERITATLNNINDHYKTDLFFPIIEKIISISGKDYSFEDGIPHRVIADHLRMVSFSLSDGIMPSNEGRGYVVRRVLRRAARFGRVLEIDKEFLYTLVDTLIEILGDAYPELIEKKDHIKKVIQSEEISFGKTLDRGLQMFEEICNNLDEKCIPGEDVFKLYDTYGFPVDLTELLARERDISIDKDNFDKMMQNQKSLARKSNKFKIDNNQKEWVIINDTKFSEFVGYQVNKIETIILKYRKNNDKNFEIVLEKTPFYAESGGQIGDSGQIKNEDFTFKVNDTYYIDNLICHCCELINGEISENRINKVVTTIDEIKRESIKVNHTSTHLLHQALKTILGNEVQQAGSLVTNDHLRFDFTYYKKVNIDQINQIEDIVNSVVQKNLCLKTNIMEFNKAKKDGAVALFGEKYDSEVRVVDIDGFSKELCGGTHVSATGQIGLFKIISESSLASGVRRIEAYTGARAFSYIRNKISLNMKIQNLLMCNDEDILEKINNISLSNKKYKKEIMALNVIKAREEISDMMDNVETINGSKLLSGEININVSPQLLSDIIREELTNKGIGLIGLKTDDKKILLCSITKDFNETINAGDIMKNIASEINAKGGGSRFMAILNIDHKLSFNKIIKTGKKLIKNLLEDK